ncbi:MAG TPA: hypothetical protein VNN09_02875 [Candidatus Competibacteraceae bacterium]|nr:hypothetical protein [Candidatus Competibacteraceae bacterium]
MPTAYYASRHQGAGRYLWRSLIFLLVLALLAGLFHRFLQSGFWANAGLNGTILGIFLFGVGYTLVALWAACADANAITAAFERVHNARRQSQGLPTPAELVQGRRGIAEFLHTVRRVVQQEEAAATLPYLLDSLSVRGEDRRALVRYLTGALVLLGLIGTFYGLVVTTQGVREVIGGLSAADSAGDLLAGLKERLMVPLGGMGLAFATSLFGLATSLSLAFLELQLFHAQNLVHARLESLVVSELLPLWQLGGRPVPQTAAVSPRYLAGLLAANAERLEQLSDIVEALGKRDATAAVARLNEQLAGLNERLESLRQTLEGLERERTAGLRHELRVLTQVLAERDLRGPVNLPDKAYHAPES